MKDNVLAADLGGTNLRMALVNSNGEILSRVKFDTPASGRRDEIVDVICEAAKECKVIAGTDAATLSLALPGTISGERGEITKAPNLQHLEGFSIGAALKERVGIPVVLENDGNAAAVGEHWLGSSRDTQTSIMITLGTGVGGGIIIDGKVVRGIDGSAGEIGHVCVEPEGLPCGCGSRGCIEQYSSATAVGRMARQWIEQNGAVNGLNSQEIDSEFVYQKAVSGEKWAREIFESQGYYLGIVLAGLINCLNPEVIVIGGGLSAAWDSFFPSLQKEVGIRAYEEPAERVRIVRASLGDNAGILGAAKLGFSSAKLTVDSVA